MPSSWPTGEAPVAFRFDRRGPDRLGTFGVGVTSPALRSAPAAASGLVDSYLVTAPDRHTKLYPNYLGRIAPRDRDLVVPSLMNTLALVGTRDELLIQPVVDPPTEMAELAKLHT
jgi:hypothetical protein